MVKKKPRVVSLWRRKRIKLEAVCREAHLSALRRLLHGFKHEKPSPLAVFDNIGLGDLLSMQHVSSGGKTAFEEGLIRESSMEECYEAFKKAGGWFNV